MSDKHAPDPILGYGVPFDFHAYIAEELSYQPDEIRWVREIDGIDWRAYWKGGISGDEAANRVLPGDDIPEGEQIWEPHFTILVTRIKDTRYLLTLTAEKQMEVVEQDSQESWLYVLIYPAAEAMGMRTTRRSYGISATEVESEALKALAAVNGYTSTSQFIWELVRNAYPLFPVLDAQWGDYRRFRPDPEEAEEDDTET